MKFSSLIILMLLHNIILFAVPKDGNIKLRSNTVFLGSKIIVSWSPECDEGDSVWEVKKVVINNKNILTYINGSGFVMATKEGEQVIKVRITYENGKKTVDIKKEFYLDVYKSILIDGPKFVLKNEEVTFNVKSNSGLEIDENKIEWFYLTGASTQKLKGSKVLKTQFNLASTNMGDKYVKIIYGDVTAIKKITVVDVDFGGLNKKLQVGKKLLLVSNISPKNGGSIFWSWESEKSTHSKILLRNSRQPNVTIKGVKKGPLTIKLIYYVNGKSFVREKDLLIFGMPKIEFASTTVSLVEKISQKKIVKGADIIANALMCEPYGDKDLLKLIMIHLKEIPEKSLPAGFNHSESAQKLFKDVKKKNKISVTRFNKLLLDSSSAIAKKLKSGFDKSKVTIKMKGEYHFIEGDREFPKIGWRAKGAVVGNTKELVYKIEEKFSDSISLDLKSIDVKGKYSIELSANILFNITLKLKADSVNISPIKGSESIAETFPSYTIDYSLTIKNEKNLSINISSMSITSKFNLKKVSNKITAGVEK
ncbi:MAG: hypothetical protein COA79_01390 [Planctomycetota bacterium]|nr:MAG: hypothetical protein COA79_01390 [Planctomycetota bacterium]